VGRVLSCSPRLLLLLTFNVSIPRYPGGGGGGKKSWDFVPSELWENPVAPVAKRYLYLVPVVWLENEKIAIRPTQPMNE
jgi:hypothetical protein